MSMLLMFLDLANTSSPPPRHPLPTVSFLFPRIFSSHHYIRPAFSDPFITDQIQIDDFSFYHGSLNRMIIWQGTTGRTSVQPQEFLSTQRNLLGIENIVPSAVYVLAISEDSTFKYIKDHPECLFLKRFKTLPKAQRTRGLSSANQSNFFRSIHKS